ASVKALAENQPVEASPTPSQQALIALTQMAWVGVVWAVLELAYVAGATTYMNSFPTLTRLGAGLLFAGWLLVAQAVVAWPALLLGLRWPVVAARVVAVVP